MTTADPSEDKRPEPTAPNGSHSAPRPVPPIDPIPGQPTGLAPVFPTGSTTASGTDEEAGLSDDASPAATAPLPAAGEPPARVSAFGEPVRPTDPDPASASTATTPIPTTPEVTTTQVVPAGPHVPATDRPGLAGSMAGQLATQNQPPVDPEWQEEQPTKRTAAHLWGVLATLILAPIAWFLLTDGALRTFYSLANVADSPNLAGLLSLAGGLLALFVIALVARTSSLGAWIWGGLIAAVGAVFLIIPSTVMEWMVQARDSFLAVNEGFGTNLYNYLLDTGRSGLLLTFGVVLLLLAMVSHSSRRSGRNEERIKARAEAQS